MNTKITLNIGLKTYLGQELTLQQVQDVVTNCISFKFESLQYKEVLGSYEGVDEPTVVVLIGVKGIVYWGQLTKSLKRMTTLLSQECIAVEVSCGVSGQAWLAYHPYYSDMCSALNKPVVRQNFTYRYFINF